MGHISALSMIGNILFASFYQYSIIIFIDLYKKYSMLSKGVMHYNKREWNICNY
jgi:hypothetical protein